MSERNAVALFATFAAGVVLVACSVLHAQYLYASAKIVARPPMYIPYPQHDYLPSSNARLRFSRTVPIVVAPPPPLVDDKRRSGPVGSQQSVQTTSSPTAQSTNRLLISILVYEPLWYLRQLFSNLQGFTHPTTLFVVHLSNRTQYSISDLAWFTTQPRLIVNPTRLVTRGYTGTLAAGHLLNIEHAVQVLDARGELNRFGYVMFWASNSWLIKPGVEMYVSLHESSMFKGFTIPEPLLGIKGKRSARLWWIEINTRLVKLSTPKGWRPTAVWARVMMWKDMRQVFELDPYPIPFSNPKETVHPLPNFQLVQFKHEGSFYPLPLIIDLITRIRAIPGAFQRLGKLRVFMEEFIVPSFARRHHLAAGRGTGAPTVLVLTTSSSAKARPLTDEEQAAKAVSIQHVKECLLNYSFVFGLKSVARTRKDYHGTRAYLVAVATAHRSGVNSAYFPNATLPRANASRPRSNESTRNNK